MQTNTGKNLFYALICVFTLIIALIGATVAYFTATASSKRDIDARAAIVEIDYVDGMNISVANLIPVKESIAKAGYDKTADQCKDDNGYTICGVYRFSITNNGDYDANIKSTLTVDKNEKGQGGSAFSNLSYIVYDVTDNDAKVIKNTSLFSETVGAKTSLFGEDINTTQNINRKTTKDYEVLIWLNEAGNDNNKEQGASFSASVSIENISR